MKTRKYIFITAVLMMLILTNGVSLAGQNHVSRNYEVTITNLTRGQIFSPPVVISHNRNFNLFTLGSAASQQLYQLAEDGNATPLTDHADTLASVFDYAVAGGPVMPGQSVSLTISARGSFRYLSVAGMLITTNDAFFGVRGLRIPLFSKAVVEAEAYDAGSEANTENCAHIPGPPCGSPGIRVTDGAEGYVHVHAGIHGLTDDPEGVDPAQHDWRNPVAEITVYPDH